MTQQKPEPTVWPSIRRGRAARLLALWCGAWTLLLYGTSLRLPFFFDDLVHLPYLDSNSVADMWRGAGDLAYYRPLPFSVWKLLALMTGGHEPVLHHGLNLVLHALNGWLVGALLSGSGRGHQPWRAALAASFFVAFPFSYQAVPWAGALTQILPTTLVLLALFAYGVWSGTGDRRWLAITVAATVLAPFAHENGALVGPLVGVVELTRRRWPGWKQVLGRGMLWSMPALLWLPWRLTVTTGRSAPLTLVSAETVLQNSAYFAQGLGLPLTWLGGWLHRVMPVSDLLLALLLTGLALVPILWWRGRHAPRRTVYPLLWFGVASLPAVLFLPFGYVIDGPRLLMLASAGAAWLWADAIAELAAAETGTLRRRLAAYSLLLLIIVPSVAFITQRQRWHLMLGAAFERVAEESALAAQDGRELTVVNMPSWIAPARATFALGHEGVLFWPDYAAPRSLSAYNGGPDRPLALARSDGIRLAPSYRYGIAGRGLTLPGTDGDPVRVAVAWAEAESIDVRPVSRLPVATFGTGSMFMAPAGLSGQVMMSPTVSLVDGGLTMKLSWEVIEPLPDDVTVFVHLVSADGRLLAQADGDPLAGLLPLSQWAPGSAVEEWRYLPAPPDATAIRIGLYRRTDGTRFSLGEDPGRDFIELSVP